MSNPNYKKGVRFEWELKKLLENEGHIVLRTAGSHGFADLVSISPLQVITFIQAKVTESEATAERLLRAFKTNPPLGHGLPPKVHQQMSVKVSRKGIRTVTV